MLHPSRSQFIGRIRENARLCREHYRLVIEVPTFPATEPGQFIQLSCRDLGEIDFQERELDWPPDQPIGVHENELAAPSAYLRRPFSLAGRRDRGGRVELDIIHRVVGAGTQWLSNLEVGDSVYLLGPLGNRFKLPSPGQTAILVGGGVGIPPMLYLAEALAGRSAVAFCGALTRDLLPLTLDESKAPSSPDAVEPSAVIQEFARHQIPSIVTTDDGSLGFRGFVTQALERYLAAQRTNCIIYTCGPEPMMKRVAAIAAERGIECQIAVERAMACGMGTCQSCCIRLKDEAAQDGWRYRLACTDGPVFAGDELLW